MTYHQFFDTTLILVFAKKCKNVVKVFHLYLNENTIKFKKFYHQNDQRKRLYKL